MRLLYVADLHYSLKQFDWLLSRAADFDMVAVGGDLLDLSSPLDPDVQIAVVEKYFHLLRAKSHLLVSSGNHDGDSRNEAQESIAQWLQESQEDGITVDHGSFIAGNTRISVCPWWDGDVTRAQVEDWLTAEASQRPASWIWIYHAPPDGSKTCWTGKKSAGDEFLRTLIERHAPNAVLCGHIHNSPFYPEGSWVDRIATTWVFNPGRQIGPEPSHIVLDLSAMTAEWTSYEGSEIQLLGTGDR
ncbi:MAG: metallophosphoesterase family protein [Terrimicrobiaceae bacterium]|nr:metallophosphoesterase family protein [Terrimicrobiaceae bacterium]